MYWALFYGFQVQTSYIYIYIYIYIYTIQYIQYVRGLWPTVGLWGPDWNRISTDLDVGLGGGWGNNLRGSYRRFLLLTASFIDSDTEIDGAGKIGFEVEENKDTLAIEARDEDSEEALVFSDSANVLAWREDNTITALKPHYWPLLCLRKFSWIS